MKQVYHIIDGQYETIDWRNMKLLTRIKTALSIVVSGRVKIKWSNLINITIKNNIEQTTKQKVRQTSNQKSKSKVFISGYYTTKIINGIKMRVWVPGYYEEKQ